MLLIIVLGLWVNFIPILCSSSIKPYMSRVLIEIRFEIIQLSTIYKKKKKLPTFFPKLLCNPTKLFTKKLIKRTFLKM